MENPGTEAFPAMLVFGPQAEHPSDSVTDELRLELVNSNALLALREAAQQLPVFWQELVTFDPALSQVPGSEFLGNIKHWLEDGAALQRQEGGSPNHFALAVTTLLQFSQYSHYLSCLGHDAHSKVVQNLQRGGAQGFCVGFLNAVAVASSRNESDLGAYAAVALRLAVCIGAYVDLDGRYASPRKDFSAVAILWKEASPENERTVSGILQRLPGVSYLPDHSRGSMSLITTIRPTYRVSTTTPA